MTEDNNIFENGYNNEQSSFSSEPVSPRVEEQAEVNAENTQQPQQFNEAPQNPQAPQQPQPQAPTQPQMPQGQYYSYTPNPNFGGQYREQPPYQQQGTYYYQGYNGEKPKKKNKGLKITVSIIGIVAIITASCLFGYWVITELGSIFNPQGAVSGSSSQKNDDSSEYEKLIINSKPDGANEYVPNSDGTLTAAAVISKVRPSIVGIVQYTNSNNGIPMVGGEGSGIIISQDGFIVTNAHVVNGASMITVVLENDEEYRATLKGIDTQSDLAVLKIEKVGLTAAELGDSTQTVLGESVIAIGNPGGLELAGSCTGGMVSGLNRTISGDETGYAMSYIQTDAAINPGNSGGALVNMYGQVIGINSAKITGEDYEGLGFAIPINEALPIISDLQNYGYVKNRPMIGITFQLITEMVSQYYNYSVPAGLLVTGIDESCDIAKKDVEINDIITQIDGQKITSASTVYSVLQSKTPGDTVKLTVYRLGTRASTSKTFEIDVVLSEQKGQ